jgi:hypothetical protein
METVERIQCGGFGNHDWWEKNQRRCVRINAAQWCFHCHKEMLEGTGWLVNWNSANDCLYPMDADLSSIRFSGHILIGNECVKRFLTKDQYAIYAKKVGGE